MVSENGAANLDVWDVTSRSTGYQGFEEWVRQQVYDEPATNPVSDVYLSVHLQRGSNTLTRCVHPIHRSAFIRPTRPPSWVQ